MITSIRYRGFSFYYKDNDNKYMKYWPIILKQ
jgi:heptose II phosphotransferase